MFEVAAACGVVAEGLGLDVDDDLSERQRTKIRMEIRLSSATGKRGQISLSQSFGYDLLDRLTSATGTGLNQGWTYDANGNRLAEAGDQPSTYTISSTSNRLSSISGALTRSYTYNASGSVTGDGTATFTYDDANRLVAATKAGITTTYALNAPGQRVRKTSAGTSTYFVYDEAGYLIGEYDDAGALIQETVWFGDIPVATIRPNGAGVDLFYVHSDHLNTPRRISRPSDNVVVWRWESDPFGRTAANEDPDGDSTQFSYALRFPGQYYDTETGMHYNYFRDYDPATGRYVQSDPIGLADGINTFSYAHSRPTLGLDPFGLFTLTTDVSWRMVDNIGGWWNFRRLGATNASVTTSCSCKLECNTWKLVECSVQFQIDVLIRNDLRADVERLTRRAEQEHVDDLLAGSDPMRQAGAAAEAAMRKQTFLSKESCESRSQAEVQSAVVAVARDYWNRSKRRDLNGSHSYPGYWPWK